MIIKSTRISTKSGTKTIKNHLLNKPEDNEKIHVIYGDESDFETFHSFSKEDNTKFSLRHFSVNPGQSWTKEQKEETVQKIREEYGATDRPYFVVEHSKKLADDSNNNHIHLLIPERFMGKTLDSKFMFKRNEKLSRMCEFDFGHEIITGKHNKAVAHALEDSKKYHELSKIMMEHAQKPMPKSAYNSEQHQIAKRQGISIPKEKLAIEDLYKKSDGWKAFHAALKDSNYTVKKGDKGTLIVEKDGNFIGALPRLLKMRKKDFNQYIKETKNESNSKRHKTRHNRDSKPSSTIRRPKQGGRTHRISSSNESQNRRKHERNKKPKGTDERDLQKDKLMTFQDIKLLNDINNSDKISFVKTEIKNNNNLLNNISKFFKSIFKEDSKINQKDLDDLNEIDNMSDDQKIMYRFTSRELEDEIFNPKKPDVEPKIPEPTKPEPPKPEDPMSKYERPKIGRQSEKKKKKPDAFVSSDTPVNLNNKLMEDVARDNDLPAAPRPF